MGRGPGGRQVGASATRVALGLAALLLALTATVTPAAASGSTQASKPKLAQVGHVAF